MLNNFTHTIFQVLICFILFMNFSPVRGQDEVVDNVRVAIKAGSSRELGRYLNNVVELSINGEKSSYSRTQAEFVLKDFFNKYPPRDFRYTHQGSSRDGLKYAIGTYTYDRGTFMIYMVIKQFGSEYRVDIINFSEE
jgi:hypothetical protein